MRTRGSHDRLAWVGLALLLTAQPAARDSQAPGGGRARAGPSSAALAAAAARTGAAGVALRERDRIVLLGSTLAERLQHFNHFETELMTRFPELQLIVRNLGWSGDTLTLQPRPLNFGDAATHLRQRRADVIIAFFGSNESFEGEAGLPQFEADLDAYLATHLAATYNGRTPPRMALVSPIAHERLAHLHHVDVEARNRALARYTDAMRRVAGRHGVAFVDLFTPTARVMGSPVPLTINGIHLTEAGDRLVGRLLMEGLGLGRDGMRDADGGQLRGLEDLREQVRRKNEEFFRRWRPLNAEYVVGRRVEPFGSVNFPVEMRELDARVDGLDERIWKAARALKGIRYPNSARESPSISAGAGR